MYKTDINGNINALMQHDIVLERRIDAVTNAITQQAKVIMALNDKVEKLEKSIEKLGSFLHG